MTRRKSDLRPRVEGVERRLLLSTLGITPTAEVASLRVASRHHIALNGNASGPVTFPPQNPGPYNTELLNGSGTVKPLGLVSVSGTVQTPISTVHGRPTGMLTLSNAKGTVTIALVGTKHEASNVFPRDFQFRITSATGIYAGAKDHGTAHIAVVIADALPPTDAATPIIGPIFLLTLKSK